ncbi:protein of unknown function [Cupriavidus taiwanensis]|nr:protein of unknown function [Cupriavidus taiwanensis]
MIASRIGDAFLATPAKHDTSLNTPP